MDKMYGDYWDKDTREDRELHELMKKRREEHYKKIKLKEIVYKCCICDNNYKLESELKECYEEHKRTIISLKEDSEILERLIDREYYKGLESSRKK